MVKILPILLLFIAVCASPGKADDADNKATVIRSYATVLNSDAEKTKAGQDRPKIPTDKASIEDLTKCTYNGMEKERTKADENLKKKFKQQLSEFENYIVDVPADTTFKSLMENQSINMAAYVMGYIMSDCLNETE